ncbi:hypothetical protein X975_04486, partial [Stegodyphus mimosarum]
MTGFSLSSQSSTVLSLGPEAVITTASAASRKMNFK